MIFAYVDIDMETGYGADTAFWSLSNSDTLIIVYKRFMTKYENWNNICTSSSFVFEKWIEITWHRIIDEGERNKWKSNLDFVYDVWKHNGNLRDNFTPIFQSFKNLIKSVKANKFVAELLGINEGDEYVMIEKIADIAYPSHENKNKRYKNIR